ncbi:MAG: adenylate/guanylate cyclase domain-containing protein [Deltaproteobacteria bacterium]|nr:adenylate/guanylate cyclase domain-containing protein [Deltaproteobacteria bacterium]
MNRKFSNKKARNKFLVTTISIAWAVVGVAFVYFFPSIGEPLDLKFYDFKLALSGFKDASEDIVHVDVDDQASQRFGIWPWDRSMSGWILKRLTELGARAVAFDVLFTSPGKSVEGNNAFFEAIKDSRNYVAATAFRVTDQKDAPLEVSTDKDRADALYDRAWQLNVPLNYDLFRAKSLETSFVPLAPILLSARQEGHIKDIPDRDGVHRRVPMFIRLEDRLIPSLSLATLAVFLGFNADSVKLNQSLEIEIPGEGKTIRIPVDSRGMMLVNWGAAWKAFPHYSVVDLLDDEPNEAKTPRYKDKIVIVGVTATGTTDFGITPLDSRAPLSRIHSNAINTILTRKFITKVPSFPYPAVIAFLITVIFVILAARMRLRIAMLTAALTLLACTVLSVLGFMFLSYEVPSSEFLIIFGPAVTICLVGRIVSVELDAYKASKALERYLSPDLVKDIIGSGAEVDLTTKKRDLTIMFVDIQGFSTMSEEVDVEHVNRFLNDFFEIMTGAVFEQKGTVDKFLGDGMLAFFGDPVPLENHALAGLEAALRMQERMKGLNAQWSHCGVPQLEKGMTIRIGLNSGSVIVGNIGSQRRLEYTVLGSVVNIASRLQSLAPPGGIIMTEATWSKVKNEIECQGPEVVRVKGIDRGIPIYKIFAENVERICSSGAINISK